MSFNYKGVSISGIDKKEFKKILHDPFLGKGKEALTLQEIIDPHIKQGKIESALALIVGLPIAIVIVYVISRFIFLPVLVWLLL